MIAEAQAAGFTITDLRDLFRRLEGRGGTFDAEQCLGAKIKETRAQIARARRFLAMLERARAALRRRG